MRRRANSFIVAALLATGALAQGEEIPPLTITLKAIGGLQYDQVRFQVRPGTNVTLILVNEDEMAHNLLITQPGLREEIVDAALKLGEEGPLLSYVPRSSKVLWSIPIVDPGQSDTLAFRSPRKTGIYPYVCTYPGHGFIMYGAMYVTNGTMPPLAHDPNIPPARKGDSLTHSGHASERRPGHPFTPVPPYVYRILLPDSGPASIAVCLPHQLAFCWDAGQCRLRYAWEGDFLDPTDYWMVKGESYARIMGTIFYRDKAAFPLRVDAPGNIPRVEFKGYRLVEKYPEFHYTIDGMDVFELIRELTGGSGLNRTFRIPDTSKTIWFVSDPADGVRYTTSSGSWEKGWLKLSPSQARQFTITMSKAAGGKL